ncbi:hypothetical protein COB11_07935 [Candidatus Aerophobetes bacterium]|uniref:AsmA domain-containing protein n=1 Tax=Aerophobetes bacterium TaxID=2030807 RepID=A0A2A4YB76_UNCAE|nr:MAG: hypothetical protein COB11_07935 [Candidatus Aerophobetes bacterium]
MRRLIGLLIILVILIIGSCFVLYYLFSDMASRILTEKLNVKASIEHITLRKEEALVRGLTIKNPSGSALKKALTVKEIDIKAPFSHYFGNPIIIDEIVFDKVYVSIELSKNNKIPCNWDYIVKHMHSEKPRWYSIKRKGLIKKLILTNVTIEIKQFGKDPQTLSPVPRMEFNDIDVDEGIPTSEFSKIIVSKMMGSIFSLTSITRLFTAPFDAFGFFLNPGSSSSDNGDECPNYSK